MKRRKNLISIVFTISRKLIIISQLPTTAKARSQQTAKAGRDRVPRASAVQPYKAFTSMSTWKLIRLVELEVHFSPYKGIISMSTWKSIRRIELDVHFS